MGLRSVAIVDNESGLREESVTFYYFAYGSNMLTKRLKQRCPGAVLFGCADADHTVIEFSKPSIDKSGKATLRHFSGKRTPGVVFEIPLKELDRLDECEGAGHGYDRCEAFPVRLLNDGEFLETTTYLATSSDRSLKPYDWYLALVIAGAFEHRLGHDHIGELQRVESAPDPDHKRKTRAEAMEALTAAGHADYLTLIQRSEHHPPRRTLPRPS